MIAEVDNQDVREYRRTIRLHRSEKGGRKNWLLKLKLGRRPPFPPGEAGR